MRRNSRLWLLLVVVAAITTGWLLVGRPWRAATTDSGPASSTAGPPAGTTEVLEISPEAQRNLGLVVQPLELATYWRTIQVPGAVVDWPGISDRGVTSPAVAVVVAVHAFPGDTVRPGDKLFTLRVFSEYLQNTQAELFKATRETQIVTEQYDRLKGLADTGSIPKTRLIELENELRRQTALIQAYRQDLLTRGLSPEQIDNVSTGTFVSVIEVLAPPPLADREETAAPVAGGQPPGNSAGEPVYEVQELKSELGQQVQAGQLLSVLANHRALYLEGHAFKQEAPDLERAAQRDWPVQVEFAEDDASGWPPVEQAFRIRHLANTVDPETRTFKFFLPLVNQSREYAKDGRVFVVWRFRPGQRVRLHVPVDELPEVFVVPAAAVVREGPEAYMFRQNGNLFNRRSVRVLHEDRRNVVVAHDGQVRPGWYMAQNGAASLNRVLKSQAAAGTPVGMHVHADGSVHGAH